MAILVQKYGGTSVATTERLRVVATRVKNEVEKGHQVVVVVSAMGKSTDNLLRLAYEVSQSPDERELDMLLTTGEQVSVSLLAMTLHTLGISAVSMTGWQAGILTEEIHGRARIREIDGAPILEQLAEGKVVIVAGFQGYTEKGAITTLGRGGSDTTAVAIAAALHAERCEIYTDVEGIYTTDPRILEAAQKLEVISYDEMLELAHLGAGVLHPRAVECAKKFGIPILVGSTFSEDAGTLVMEGRKMILESGLLVTGIAFDDEVAKIKLEGLPHNVTTLSDLFELLATHHINVDIIVNSTIDSEQTSVSFTVSTSELEKTIGILEKNQEYLQFKRLFYKAGLAKVSIVGSGMISNHGVAAQMFKLLGAANIEIKMVSTSEIKISTVISREQGEAAIRILHEGFQLDRTCVSKEISNS